ncbi:MAG: SWIM zinc finger domain-containing protein [Gammaproteobacteria bacterium]|nr:SWIM zinc finger domain-containing protein [Gammaproteobacteria bacterium]
MIDYNSIIFKCKYQNIERGRQYYLNGNVYDVVTDNENISAKVKGNYSDYNVKFSISRSKEAIYDASCTCPVKGYCKHIVATLYYLSAIDYDYDDSKQFIKASDFKVNYVYGSLKRVANIQNSSIERYYKFFSELFKGYKYLNSIEVFDLIDILFSSNSETHDPFYPEILIKNISSLFIDNKIDDELMIKLIEKYIPKKNSMAIEFILLMLTNKEYSDSVYKKFDEVLYNNKANIINVPIHLSPCFKEYLNLFLRVNEISILILSRGLIDDRSISGYRYESSCFKIDRGNPQCFKIKDNINKNLLLLLFSLSYHDCGYEDTIMSAISLMHKNFSGSIMQIAVNTSLMHNTRLSGSLLYYMYYFKDYVDESNIKTVYSKADKSYTDEEIYNMLFSNFIPRDLESTIMYLNPHQKVALYHLFPRLSLELERLYYKEIIKNLKKVNMNYSELVLIDLLYEIKSPYMEKILSSKPFKDKVIYDNTVKSMYIRYLGIDGAKRKNIFELNLGD